MFGLLYFVANHPPKEKAQEGNNWAIINIDLSIAWVIFTLNVRFTVDAFNRSKTHLNFDTRSTTDAGIDAHICCEWCN